MANLIISPILEYAIKNNASDIHITEGEALGFRINGNLGKLPRAGIIDKQKINQILLELLKDDKAVVKSFLDGKDFDFAYIYTDGTPFRVNAFFKLGRIAFVMRRIASKPKTIEELGLPAGVEKFTKAKQGLILVTGPTGSGKSTSMVSILDAINKSRREHIITIEDPVEFIFKDENCIFSQREIGKDTHGFDSALRAAMREDPDIVMVGEMRDRETVEAAMELAETGHLVISTLHTSGSVQTITRIVNFFHPELQHSVRYKLADTLFGVLSQRLIPTPNKDGRQGIFELMFMTSGIKNLIRQGDFAQIPNSIEMGSQEGMVSMKTYADRLKDKGIINEEDYINYFADEM
ncbi:MAG: PilT/PilU family type 4a pilus ATPase [Candidatus Gracilibacteria bacterium]|nr:PilT/PilU family type 4a pilus ATPase [Candidatus Gracilibacteria bacterium]